MKFSRKKTVLPYHRSIRVEKMESKKNASHGLKAVQIFANENIFLSECFNISFFRHLQLEANSSHLHFKSSSFQTIKDRL